MTTALSLIQSACYEIGIPAPTTIYASTDPVNLQLLRFLYAEAQLLRRMRIFPQQKKRYSFSTTNGRAAYPLPEDFYSMLPNTLWDQSQDLPLYGPVGDSEWNARLYRYTLLGPPFGYRIFGPDFNPTTAGGQFKLDPTPTSTVTLSFEYVSKNLFVPPNWVGAETVTINHYRFANGNIYKYTTGGVVHASTPPSHTTGTVADGTGQALYISAPYETILADADQSLFDDDIMIHGVKWRYKQSKGLDYQSDQVAHRSMIDIVRTRLIPAYVGSGTRFRRIGPRYWVPLRNWGI